MAQTDDHYHDLGVANEPTYEVAVPTEDSQGSKIHAPGAPCGSHLTTDKLFTLWELNQQFSADDLCANCVEHHDLDIDTF